MLIVDGYQVPYGFDLLITIGVVSAAILLGLVVDAIYPPKVK